jgi:hypothetical protein
MALFIKMLYIIVNNLLCKGRYSHHLAFFGRTLIINQPFIRFLVGILFGQLFCFGLPLITSSLVQRTLLRIIEYVTPLAEICDTGNLKVLLVDCITIYINDYPCSAKSIAGVRMVRRSTLPDPKFFTVSTQAAAAPGTVTA